MHTLHLISHTHWDREWHQTYQQFRLRLVHLLDGLLDLLDGDSRYQHFMLDGQTIVLDDYLDIRPEREVDLRRYVQNGRILIGPWYILPDEFLTSPEAAIRNLLEGARIARRFGPRMMIGYIPDPFGHIGQMPQILRGFGIHTASLWRGVDAARQPNEFWWQSPDGSQVLMAFLRQGYANAAGILGNSPEDFVAGARSQRDLLAAHTSGEHLLLMHGVDHQEAQPGTSAAVAYAEGKLDGDRLIHSSLPHYFACVQAGMDLDQLPVVRGELRSPRSAPMLPGVLSARMWIKQRNAVCQTLLEQWAEPFSALAQSAGAHPADNLRQPQSALRQAWRLLMQCHPHDSICGCSIDQVHDEVRPRFDQVEQIAEEITRQSLEALAATIATRPADAQTPLDHPETMMAGAEGALTNQPIPFDLAQGDRLVSEQPAAVGRGRRTAPLPSAAVVVFNPGASSRTDAVNVVVDAPTTGGEFDLLNDDGAPAPFQLLGLGSSDLVNIQMDRTEFRSAFNMVAAGSDVVGMKLLGLRVQREGSEATLEVLAGQTGEPDREAWDRSRLEVQALLDDLAVTTYNVRVHSVAANSVLFVARDVPGLGYRTYHVYARPGAPKEPARLGPLARAMMPLGTRLAANPALQQFLQRMTPDPAGKPPYRIENEFYAVEVQPDGSLNVHDKRSGVLYRGQNRFVDGGDRGDEYNYSPPDADRLAPARLKSVRVLRGAVQQTLDIALELDAPVELAADRKSRSRATVLLPITSRVTLTAGVARVDIHTEIDNRARDHRLRVHFAVPFAVHEADYDGHFEVARRPLGVPAFDATWSEQPRPEAPQRAFCAVSDGNSGLLIANRGLPEVEVLTRGAGQADIALTLLRCVGWLSRDDLPERKGPAGPKIVTPGAQLPGHWAFDYAIIGFGIHDRLSAYHQAYAFQTPLRALSSILHDGPLPASAALLQVEPPEFILSAVKIADDGRGWLARGYNIGDWPLTVTLTTLPAIATAARVNLAEEPEGVLAACTEHEVRFEVRAHEVATVRLQAKV